MEKVESNRSKHTLKVSDIGADQLIAKPLFYFFPFSF